MQGARRAWGLLTKDINEMILEKHYPTHERRFLSTSKVSRPLDETAVTISYVRPAGGRTRESLGVDTYRRLDRFYSC